MKWTHALPPGRSLLGLPALAAVALSFATSPAAAQASAPAKVPGAELQLIAGPVDGASADAGIDLRLSPGWKTYWRYPGDSGVPPALNWSGSDNVLKVEMEWPAPKRFADGGGGYSIGYKGAVLFPLKVELKEPGKPARLQIAFDFAVCEALCMPARAELAVALDGRAGPDASRITAARALVPVEQAVGAADVLAVEKVDLDQSVRPARLVIDVKAAGPKADLFVEGPDERWALPLPQKTALPDGTARFTLALDGVPSGVDPAGAALKLTLVDGARAVSTQVSVPGPAAAR
ncbi:protein-disulfide reductase DsbD domain-containing protein [Xanthobacter sp. KR7-65]|uniref:protein-disulfide reductase DsbD domain-containing protein n=1 Tax=Xanthobacter sp. KR7-65 TaxID=3156612 RepID=UPI0032B3BAD2